MNLYEQILELAGSNDEHIIAILEYRWTGQGLTVMIESLEVNGTPMALNDLTAFDKELVDIEVENERSFREQAYGTDYEEAAQEARNQDMIDVSRGK